MLLLATLLFAGQAISEPKLLTAFSYGKGPMRAILGPRVFTDAGTVAGYYCESVGVHGESYLAKPFVMSAGSVIWLPLGGRKYGQVRTGDDKRLAGYVVDNKYNARPAIWTADLEHGWRAAKLRVFDQEKGWFVATDPDGRLYAESRTPTKDDENWVRVLTGDRLLTICRGKFDFSAVDAGGALYGTLFERIELGHRRMGQVAAVWRNGKFHKMASSWRADMSAVNRSGLAVGSVLAKGWRAAKWKNRALSLLARTEGATYMAANAVDDNGIIGGEYASGDVKACMWRDGKFEDLGYLFPQADSTVAAMSPSGLILVKVEDRSGYRLYQIAPAK